EFASRAGDGLEAAVVLDGETDRRAEALAARFKGCSVLSINKCYRAVRVRRDRIFGAAPGGPAGSSALPFLAAALLAVLFPVLRVSAGRLEAVEAALLEAAREEARRGERAEALAAEIKSLEVPETGSRPGADSAAPAGAPGNAGVYGIIAGLCRVLPDCRIRSLSIRGGRFSLEAEGQDSLAAAAALADSPLFSGITLSGTSPAEGRGEVFTLSGALRHGE
ncbi:MAG: hypothetical protein LBQ35_09440, partial [Spirochaetaceae bacterium]|nr:hypothetical protein [Spirochaetaceae bacterium]